jgi:hypothetical protein
MRPRKETEGVVVVDFSEAALEQDGESWVEDIFYLFWAVVLGRRLGRINQKGRVIII